MPMGLVISRCGYSAMVRSRPRHNTMPSEGASVGWRTRSSSADSIEGHFARELRLEVLHLEVDGHQTALAMVIEQSAPVPDRVPGPLLPAIGSQRRKNL
jgi:hypothetical protein